MIRDTLHEQQLKQMKPQRKILKNRQSLLLSNQKNINCLFMFGDRIFIGTKLSKLFIYEYDFETHCVDNQKIIIPHCETVSFITAQQRYFITIPEAEDQSNVSMWDMKSYNFMTSLSGHTSQISGAVFLSQENWLATSSWDGTVKIWNLQNILDVKMEQIKSDYPVLTIEEFRKDFIIFGGDDCYINVWNWKKKQEITKCFGHAGSLSFLYSMQYYFISCGGDQLIKIWQITEDQAQPSIKQQSKGQVAVQMQIQHKFETEHYKLTTTNSQKKYYDSCIFMIPLNKDTFFFIDRHGEKFIMASNQNNTQIFSQKNQFLYYDSITGVARPTKNRLLISTASNLNLLRIMNLRSKDDNMV